MLVVNQTGKMFFLLLHRRKV